jgi:hypothetical protein
MLYRKIIAISSESHIKLKYTVWEEGKILNVKPDGTYTSNH